MASYTDRRLWLKQTALALAGLGLSSFDTPAKPHFEEETIVLSNNENAYGPSPAARKAMLQTYLQSHRYPDGGILLLQKAVAAHCKLTEENILLGAGSSEIIGLACQLAAKKAGHVISADPSYEEWMEQATAFGMAFRKNHLPRQNNLPVAEIYGPVTESTRMIYICNPNNPTGMSLDPKAVAAFAEEASGKAIVFIDEAYAEYGGIPSLAALAATHRNIIVARTFSKIYGLAGARIGYAVSHPDTIHLLSSYQPWLSANCSAVSVAAAIASLQDVSFVNDCYEKNKLAKEHCYTSFQQLGIDYIPSAANFVLLNIDRWKDRFITVMEQRKILVKYRNAYGGKWCRVTMGTEQEMQVFTDAVREATG